MEYTFLQTLYDDILLIIKNLVVKRDDVASSYESTASALNFELYYACLTGSKYFFNFPKFDMDILESVLRPNIAGSLQSYYEVPNLIPEEYRAQLIDLQSVRVVETYVETNEYYRILTGLPPLSSNTPPIYITDYPEIPSDIPIHELSDEDISFLSMRGVIDALKVEYPNLQYLDYLGLNRIDLIYARKSKPFYILRTGIPKNNDTLEMFNTRYYSARRYIMASVYNRQMFNDKTLYDPIIGLIMISLAIRNTLVPTEAEYYNFEEILDLILESYDMYQYFSTMPITYKRRLVIAMDKLLSIKGTDAVLVEVCKIFDVDSFTANRYYLMKTHRKDVDGNIIFSDDPNEAYELNFIKGNIEEGVINYSDENIIPYNSVINNDYLWQLTPEETTKLMGEDFNIMMSKYIDIEAAYDLSSLTFEICYFINLVISARENLAGIQSANMYAESGSSSAFTMIIFMLASAAKHSGWDGNVVYEPNHIAEILRFNTSDISEELSAIINSYEEQIDVTDTLLPDQELVLSKPMGIETEQSIVEVYVRNRELYNAILHEMQTTNDIRKYRALSQAKQCMYVSAMEEVSFTKSDGTVANTYYELLSDLDPSLARRLDQVAAADDPEEFEDMMIYTLEKLEYVFSSDELSYLFINTPGKYLSLITKYIRTVINVFKASSVQFDSLNVLFTIGNSHPARGIDHVSHHKNIDITDTGYGYDEVGVNKTIVISDYAYGNDKPYMEEY